MQLNASILPENEQNALERFPLLAYRSIYWAPCCEHCHFPFANVNLSNFVGMRNKSIESSNLS